MRLPKTYPSEIFTIGVGGGKCAKRETGDGALPAVKGGSFWKKKVSAAVDDAQGSRRERSGKGLGVDL